MVYSTPEHRSFHPIAGHTVRADFEGGALSSDFGVVVPDYSYPLECLTFEPFPCTLTSNHCALSLASSPKGLADAIGLLSPVGLRRIALSVSRVSAPRKYGLAASAGCLSTNR